MTARALAAKISGDDKIFFLCGTQSLRYENQVRENEQCVEKARPRGSAFLPFSPYNCRSTFWNTTKIREYWIKWSSHTQPERYGEARQLRLRDLSSPLLHCRHISTSSNANAMDIFCTCYGKFVDGKSVVCAAMWRLKEGGVEHAPLDQVCELPHAGSVRW